MNPDKPKPLIVEAGNVVQSKTSESPVGRETDEQIKNGIDVMLGSSTVRVYDKGGKQIFIGDPKQLLTFVNNKDYGKLEDISNISDENGKTILRFGPTDGRGFISRTKIEGLFQKLRLQILRQENQVNDQKKLDDMRDKIGLPNTAELSPQQKSEIMQEIKKINNNVYFSRRGHLNDDLFAVSMGVDIDTGNKLFDVVSGEVGQFFDAHGIAKLRQLESLLTILENGIDPTKPFYTAPFEVPKEDKAGLGAALGTAGGTAYKDGIAVLTGGYGEKISEKGIKHVFINDVYADLKQPLSKLFPQYQVHLLSEQKQVMEREANV